MTIFISYSPLDSEFVDRLIHEFEERGIDAWVDFKDSRRSSDWRASTSQAMRQCQAVVVVLSPHFAASDNAAKELSLADHYKRPIIPIRKFTEERFSDAVDEVVRALHALPPPPAGHRPAKQIEPIQTATQDKSRTESLQHRRHGLLATLLIAIGLVLGLKQMGAFDWPSPRVEPDPRTDGTQKQESPSPHSAAASATTNPEARAGAAAYKVLAVQGGSHSFDERTLRFSLRVTVSKDSNGVGVNRNFFRLVADGLALAPTKYPDETLPPQTAKDFDVEFLIPRAVTPAFLQVGDVRGETAEIPVDPQTKSAPIFISYSRRDSEFADRLIHELEARGFDAWVDREDIRGGTAWRASISQAMRKCQAVIVVLSPRSAASENVAKELSLADHHKRPIIPISLEPSAIPAALEFQLAGLQIIEFTQAGFSDSVDKVVQALHTLSPYPLPAGFRAGEQIDQNKTTAQDKSRAGFLPLQGYGLLGTILATTGLVIGLKQMGAFERREPRTRGAQGPVSPISDSAAEPAASLGINPEAIAGVSAYQALAVHVGSHSSDKRTLRFPFE
jgi:TIR domain